MNARERKVRRVFVDMDGVVVDFDSYRDSRGLTGDEVKSMVGAYLEMQPLPGAIEAVRSLIGMGFEVWLATKPPTGVAHAYSDKAAWVFKHLPELKRRIVITHDKGMLGGPRDFLCDDRPHKANCEKFTGTLLRFVDGYHWPEALRDIRSALIADPRAATGEGVWRPIETAPKDHVRILLFAPDAVESEAVFSAVFDGGYWWESGDADEPIDVVPTHWQPLPIPPKECEECGGTGMSSYVDDDGELVSGDVCHAREDRHAGAAQSDIGIPMSEQNQPVRVLPESHGADPSIGVVHNTDTPGNFCIVTPGLPKGTLLYGRPQPAQGGQGQQKTVEAFGKDCPAGMVQVEFVGCSPKSRNGDYGWLPQESAFLEIYVDGARFRIDVGNFDNGHGKGRGLHIVTSELDLRVDKHSMNAMDVYLASRNPALESAQGGQGQQEPVAIDQLREFAWDYGRSPPPAQSQTPPKEQGRIETIAARDVIPQEQGHGTVSPEMIAAWTAYEPADHSPPDLKGARRSRHAFYAGFAAAEQFRAALSTRAPQPNGDVEGVGPLCDPEMWVPAMAELAVAPDLDETKYADFDVPFGHEGVEHPHGASAGSDAVPAAWSARWNGERMPDNLRDYMQGMEISVDVSTCDADSEHRYFGTVTEVMDGDGKNGVILLMQDAEPNFELPKPAAISEKGRESIRRFVEITTVPQDTLDRLMMGRATDGDQLIAHNALAAFIADMVLPPPNGVEPSLRAAATPSQPSCVQDARDAETVVCVMEVEETKWGRAYTAHTAPGPYGSSYWKGYPPGVYKIVRSSRPWTEARDAMISAAITAKPGEAK